MGGGSLLRKIRSLLVFFFLSLQIQDVVEYHKECVRVWMEELRFIYRILKIPFIHALLSFYFFLILILFSFPLFL